MPQITTWIVTFLISGIAGGSDIIVSRGEDDSAHVHNVGDILVRVKRQIPEGTQTDDKKPLEAQINSSGEAPTDSTITELLNTGSVLFEAESGTNETTSLATPWWNRIDTETIPCNAETHEGCDVTHFKRCSKDGVCICLKGYVLNREYSECVAAQYFRGDIRLFIDLNQWLNGTDTTDGRKLLKAHFRNALLSLLSAENVDSLLDVQVVEIEERSGAIIRFEIVLDKRTAPRQEGLQATYRFAIMNSLVTNQVGSYVIRGTSLVLAPVRANLTDVINSLSLKDFNHCLDPGHNYCDHNAVCTNRMGSFVCRCRVGYTDVSPDLQASPGERCTPTCGCQNNGTCVINDGLVSCRCPQWFLGEKCEIDGKMLLIVLCSVLGGLLLITMIFCLICVCAFKKKARRAKRSTAATISSIDSTLIKLPRPWMDTSRSYEAPPRDLRRWSYVSEPIRYADELMIDDHYHSETLPLPHSYDQTRRQMASYQVRYNYATEPGVPQRDSTSKAVLPYGKVQDVRRQRHDVVPDIGVVLYGKPRENMPTNSMTANSATASHGGREAQHVSQCETHAKTLL